MSLNVTVTLDIKTCPCGFVFAVPNWIVNYRCPGCAQRAMTEILDENRAKSEALAERDRTIAALRGALTRTRNAKGDPR